MLVEGLTRSLVAAKAQKASTKTVGGILLQLIYTMLDYNTNDTDRVLNGPTNDTWLNPWLDYLISMGVKYHKGEHVTGFEIADGKISGALVQNIGKQSKKVITGDYYILAVPVEKAVSLISREMLKIDPALQNIIQLSPNVEWMNGIQFYLNAEVNLNYGHTIYSYSNWALTSISQIQFWDNYDLSHRFNGKVKSILSVDISSWYSNGNCNNKKAMDCTPEEIKAEVWEQLKLELNTTENEILNDSMKEFVHLDNDITPIPTAENILIPKEILTEADHDYFQKVKDMEPLLVNQINTWTLRPNAFTNIPNLFLASDYIKTNTDLATMEGANEAARRAVNLILDAEGKSDYCQIWPLYEPSLFGLAKRNDRKRYLKGLEWSPHLPVLVKIITFVWGLLYIVKGVIVNILFKKKT
ncbi:MAG: FAD-dependent oxidoreductase [Saprospiraceae bacterium]